MKPSKDLFKEAQSFRQQISQYLRMLFDFSFTEFITIQMTPLLFGVSLAGTLIFLLYLTGDAFVTSPTRGLFYLFVITPVGFIVAATVIRALMEFYLVVFRIAENVNDFTEVKQHVEKLAGISDTMGVVTKRIPFWKLLTRRPNEKKEKNERNEKAAPVNSETTDV